MPANHAIETISQEAYDRAKARYTEARAGLMRARHVVELAETEMEAAAVELARHESEPGIPLYTRQVSR